MTTIKIEVSNPPRAAAIIHDDGTVETWDWWAAEPAGDYIRRSWLFRNGNTIDMGLRYVETTDASQAEIAAVHKQFKGRPYQKYDAPQLAATKKSEFVADMGGLGAPSLVGVLHFNGEHGILLTSSDKEWLKEREDYFYSGDWNVHKERDEKPLERMYEGESMTAASRLTEDEYHKRRKEIMANGGFEILI